MLCISTAACRLRHAVRNAIGHAMAGDNRACAERISRFNSTNISPGIQEAYQRLLVGGQLEPDDTQLAAVYALQMLQNELLQLRSSRKARDMLAAMPSTCSPHIDGAADPTNSGSSGSSSSSRSSSSSGSGSTMPHVQGAYLFGPVGSGKTMLLDLFCATLQQQSDALDPLRISRLHYHEFVLGIHQQLHVLQQSLPRRVVRSRDGLLVYRHALPHEDPLRAAARAAADAIDVLCLDELAITDAADAALFGRLLPELLGAGCTLLLTCNRPPRALHSAGAAGAYLAPLLRLVDERLLQLRVAGGRDYRARGKCGDTCSTTDGSDGSTGGSGCSGGQWLLGEDADAELERCWHVVSKSLAADAEGAPAHISLAFGRTLRIPRALLAPTVRCCEGLPGRPQVQAPVAPLDASTAVISATARVEQQQQQQQHEQAPPLQDDQQTTGALQRQGILHTHQHTHQGVQDNQLQPEQCRLAAAWFEFDQLCGNRGSSDMLSLSGALSSNDFVALVQHVDHIFVRRVPQLTLQHRDEARRLVTLLDVLYEAHTRSPGCILLHVSADVAPAELFVPLLGAAAAGGLNPNLGRARTAQLDVAELLHRYQEGQQRDRLSAGSAERLAIAAELKWQRELEGGALQPEEVLAYHRAASRLQELCSVTNCTATAQTCT